LPERVVQHKHVGIVVLVLVALTVGWFGGRSSAPYQTALGPDARKGSDNSTSKAKIAFPRHAANIALTPAAPKATTPLPPPGTPLKQAMAELQARAQAGDAEAATRLYHDTQRCVEYSRLKTLAPQLAHLALGDAGPVTTNDLKNNDQFLSVVQNQLAFVHDNADFCTGLDDNDINQLSLPSALQAALLGNSAAADCYVGVGGAVGVPPGLIDHPEWLSEYKENALSLANAGVENGDWAMVNQLYLAYRDDNISNIGMLHLVTGSDNQMAYRYEKLNLLGVSKDDKNDVLDTMQTELQSLSKDLTPEQITAADAWAQNAYASYFGSDPRSSVSPPVCAPD
jgi:hypothetical protein